MQITLFFYLLKELIPQFFTSLCVLSTVIVVSQLVRLSEVLVTFGVSLENVFLPFLFLLVPFLAFTIPMAYLFAVVLTFSRLSADGEYTAMLASGFSLRRAAAPILIVGAIVSAIGSVCALNFEPWGRRETVQFYQRKTQTELDNMIRFRMQPGVFLDNFLGYVLYAEKISADRTRFENVMLGPGAGREDQNFTLLAPTATLLGSVESGELKMSFDYGVIYAAKAGETSTSVVKFKRAELDVLRIFQEQIFGPDSSKDDFRSYTPTQLSTYIDKAKIDLEKEPNRLEKKDAYYKSRFLIHQRVGMPFAALVFACFGMVLGIHDDRRGKGFGFVGSILTIMGGYIVIMFFKWLAEKGAIGAPVGVWLPNFLLGGFGAFLVYQRNRLPPSESPLDPRFVPGLNRLTANVRGWLRPPPDG